MLSITLSYKLTEKGQRFLLKLKDPITPATARYDEKIEAETARSNFSKKLENIEYQKILIPYTHESYDALVDMVDIKTDYNTKATSLTLNCTSKNSPYLQIADENSIRIFSSKSGHLYVEADRLIELTDIPFILQTFLLNANVREQIKIKEQEQIAALKEEAASKDMECLISTEISTPNFAELVAQLRDGTYVPTIHVTYTWAKSALPKFLKHFGWEDLPLDRDSMPCHALHASKDFDLTAGLMGNYGGRYSFWGYNNDYTMIAIPKKDEYEKRLEIKRLAEQEEKKKEERIKELQKQKEARKDDFAKNEASNYLKNLIRDKKSYTHVLDREILTKYYPNAVLYKEYDTDTYKSRDCPSVADYKLIKKIQKKYPNNSCKLAWLEIKDEDDGYVTAEWEGCVVIMDTDYAGMEVVFGYPSEHAGKKQIPLTEEELKEANSNSL